MQKKTNLNLRLERMKEEKREISIMMKIFTPKIADMELS